MTRAELHRRVPPSAVGHRPGRPHRHRVRLEPDVRINMIVDGAVAFFAEHGFMAQTRELARRVGVSQSLIYHYFSTKEDLIERVYERTFLSNWCQDWVGVITDRDMPLAARLKSFYSAYMQVIDDKDWIRIAMFSGLENADLARRYVEGQVEEILRAIAGEIAHESRPGRHESKPDELDLELVWHLHSTFIHYLVRKHIFRTRTISDTALLIDNVVDQFLAGASARAGAVADQPRAEGRARVEAAE